MQNRHGRGNVETDSGGVMSIQAEVGVMSKAIDLTRRIMTLRIFVIDVNRCVHSQLPMDVIFKEVRQKS